MAVLLPRTDLTRGARIAERLRSRVEAMPFTTSSGLDVKVTVSCGVAEYNEQEPPPDLFERSDRNLYAAKQGGRNRIVAEEHPEPPPA